MNNIEYNKCMNLLLDLDISYINRNDYKLNAPKDIFINIQDFNKLLKIQNKKNII